MQSKVTKHDQDYVVRNTTNTDTAGEACPIPD